MTLGKILWPFRKEVGGKKKIPASILFYTTCLSRQPWSVEPSVDCGNVYT